MIVIQNKNIKIPHYSIIKIKKGKHIKNNSYNLFKTCTKLLFRSNRLQINNMLNNLSQILYNLYFFYFNTRKKEDNQIKHFNTLYILMYKIYDFFLQKKILKKLYYF